MLLDRLIHISSLLEHYNDLEADKGTTVYVLINTLIFIQFDDDNS